MDITRFNDGKTGTLIPIKVGQADDHAFIPDKLPPRWFLPPALVPKLIEARSAISLLDGIGRTLPDPELLLVPLKKREAITSSRIEGTYATAQELMLFEMNPSESKTRNDVNAWREVSNYSRALTEGVGLLSTYPFCGKVMKELHKTLMRNVRGQHSVPGQWRDYQVAIGSDRRYVPPPPNEVSPCMDDLEKYINTESDFDPLMRAYLVHYQFEAIHPFADGNGRIGRVLLSLMIANWCKLSRPWLYMSSFFERYKDEYIDNLFKISAAGAWEKWVDFCLTGTIHQANDAINRCEKLRNLRGVMLEKCQDASPRMSRIINGLFSSPFVRVSQLQRDLDVTYQTAQFDVNKLVKAQILKPLLGVHPKSYYAPEVYRIAYAEQDGEMPLSS